MASSSENTDQDQNGDSEPEDTHALDRRDFLRTSALLGACFADPRALRAALANARLQGKPVLTQKTLNAFLAQTHGLNAATKKQMATEAKASLAAFLGKHFALTETQRQVVTGYTAKDRSVLGSSIDTALAKNAKIAVTIASAPASASPTRRPLPTGGRRLPARDIGGAADWKHRWLNEKRMNERSAAPDEVVTVGDNIASMVKTFAHGGIKSTNGQSTYSGEVGIEATC